jgi:hypothetical protein
MVADPVVDVGQVPVARKLLEIMNTLHKARYRSTNDVEIP